MSANPTVNYLGYTANLDPPTPPPGVFYTFLDSTLTMKKIDSAGTITDLGGNGGASFPTGPGLVQVDGAAVATKATAANLLAALQLAAPLLNEVITAPGTLTNLVLAPTGWTLNGDTDGDLVFAGELLTPVGAGATYTFQPNAISGTNQLGAVDFGSTAGVTAAAITSLYLGATTGTNACRLAFRIEFSAKSGRNRIITSRSMVIDPTAGTKTRYAAIVEWADTSTVVGPTSQINGSAASQILINSWVKVTRNLMAA